MIRLFSLIICFPLFIAAQTTVIIPEINYAITVDGELDEEIWKQPFPIHSFIQNFPTDSLLAKTRTEVSICYDQKNLYIAAKCFDSMSAPFIIQSLKRDFSITRSDALVVSLSPVNDKINGYSFGLNPYGVQREGLVANAGAFGVTTAWDNLWYSEVKNYGSYWTCEMRIPYSTIRFKKSNRTWGVNIARINLKTNETSVWSPVPLGFNVSHLGFTNYIHFEQPLKRSGRSFSLIPYVAGGAAWNFTDPSGKQIKNLANAGFDVKLGVTSNLNLDVTVNPDFSQVEVDDQVINLDRFELFFPERRQFFIENGDLFDQFGFSRIRPFFSRRIGLLKGTNIPIIAAARLSGNINKDWRIGLMNLQTLKNESLDVPMQNYTVAAVQRRVFNRSNISFITVNKYNFKKENKATQNLNNVSGVDFNLYSKNNLWRGKFFYHHSFYGDTIHGDGGANAIWLNFKNRNWDVHFNHEYVGTYYKAETGFVPRTGYFRLEPMFRYTHFTKHKKILNHSGFVYYSQYWDNKTWKSTDRLNQFQYKIIFRNTAEFSASYQEYQTLLARDLQLSKNIKITASNYLYRGTTLSFLSDFRKKFSWSAGFDIGSFFDRQRYALQAGGNFRFQPWGSFSLNFNQGFFVKTNEKMQMISLLSSKLDLSFTRELFFNAILQYNTQADQFSTNIRFQWRFRPMSDLFIVYTDGYSGELLQKNRAFIIKFVYWFNI